MTTNGEDQPKPPLFQRIKAQNVLSFGPNGIDLELGPLNVLIGPNGSGKSNLLDAINLLIVSSDLRCDFIGNRGTVSDWVWRGVGPGGAVLEAEVLEPGSELGFTHRVEFVEANGSFTFEESITTIDPTNGNLSGVLRDDGESFGSPTLTRSREPRQKNGRHIQSDDSMGNSPSTVTAIESLYKRYENVRFYRDVNNVARSMFGCSAPRKSGPLQGGFTDIRDSLDRLMQFPDTRRQLYGRLSDLVDPVVDINLRIDRESVGLGLVEDGFEMPASRISLSFWRYLCLVAILLDSDPPPFIAIEEPDLGIHPDLLFKLADMLVDASSRTQIVVTTHSSEIVDAMTDRPEVIVAFDYRNGRYTAERLDPSRIARWLEKESLSSLWASGELGGVVW